MLILGANGQVGKELSRRAGNFEVNATVFTRTELDITDSQAVARILALSSRRDLPRGARS